MDYYYQVPQRVFAIQFDGTNQDDMLEEFDGTCIDFNYLQPGDWVIVFDSGLISTMPDEYFHDHYVKEKPTRSSFGMRDF